MRALSEESVTTAAYLSSSRQAKRYYINFHASLRKCVQKGIK